MKTVTDSEAELVHPFASVTITEYDPLSVAVIACVVAPFDQLYADPAEADKSTEPPAQKLSGPDAETLACAGVKTVTVSEAELVHPLASVTVTAYDPLSVAVIACVVAPFDQLYADPVEADKSTDPPAQKLSGPDAETLACSVVKTVTVAEAELVHPFASVTVTANDPLSDAVMACVVAPLDQL